MSDIEIRGFLPKHGAGTQDQGVKDLRRNLGAFSFDALTQLEADLREGTVKRGTWDGCVISYMAGEPGSVHQDVDGRSGNSFTLLWDQRWMTFPAVLREVQAEIARRKPEWTPPAPAEVPATATRAQQWTTAAEPTDQDFGLPVDAPLVLGQEV